MTTTTKPEWMLSQNAIARRMYRETSEKRGLRGLAFELHTQSVFAIENIRLGHADVAETNLRKARRAFRRLTREAGDEKAPRNLQHALTAYQVATASMPR